ncbi:hypothetical protein MKW98_020207 [Papaver atlanticum]|uniref:Uncharacterized protein n=1 Tax=Papaver atlanticum TaxID=357466 RepID=A0AAD4XBK2_9MAGN|nr:hypothetical protein MKW98_020207 [Papaver atlanticum]
MQQWLQSCRGIRYELANQNAETSNLTNKLDREIHALRAQMEAAKYDVIKYCFNCSMPLWMPSLSSRWSHEGH